MGLFTRRKTVMVDSDILVIGGGMGGCGATYESRYWGRDLKIVCVEKANIERSGAVAQGLYAINCYMGMQWNENLPEDHVRYARNDLMVWCARIWISALAGSAGLTSCAMTPAAGSNSCSSSSRFGSISQFN